MISDDKLNMFIEDPDAFPPTLVAMAKELQAYRQAFREPVAWVHGPTGIPLVNPEVREELKLCPASIPLYRKPTIP